jgi:hypothetical protein
MPIAMNSKAIKPKIELIKPAIITFHQRVDSFIAKRIKATINIMSDSGNDTKK